jgi:hypothetical protein
LSPWGRYRIPFEALDAFEAFEAFDAFEALDAFEAFDTRVAADLAAAEDLVPGAFGVTFLTGMVHPLPAVERSSRVSSFSFRVARSVPPVTVPGVSFVTRIL